MTDRDAAVRPMTAAHKRAIATLERAFRTADRAGLAVCGMDNSLYAYRADDFDALAAELPSAYEVQQTLTEASETLDTSGVYRESGAW